MADWTEVTVSLKEHITALSAADQRALQIKETADETARILREISPERHAQMCRTIRETFEALYDPAADAEAVRGLL